MKGEVNVAPLLSVGMGWHSGRPVGGDTHHGRSHPGALFSNGVQSGLVIEDNLCVRLGREGLCLHSEAVTYSTQMGGPRFHMLIEIQSLLWEQCTYLCLFGSTTCGCVWVCSP